MLSMKLKAHAITLIFIKAFILDVISWPWSKSALSVQLTQVWIMSVEFIKSLPTLNDLRNKWFIWHSMKIKPNTQGCRSNWISTTGMVTPWKQIDTGITYERITSPVNPGSKYPTVYRRAIQLMAGIRITSKDSIGVNEIPICIFNMWF